MAPLTCRAPVDHLDLLRRVAAGFYCPGMEKEDLAQEGYPGLIRACETFDESLGTPFENWATLKIRGAISNAIQARGGGAIHVPPRQARALLADPSPSLTLDQRQRREAATRAIKGGAISDGMLDDGNLGGAVADYRRSFDPTEFRLDVKPRLDELPGRCREIIKRHFGLDDGDEQEPERIARSLGLKTTDVMDALEEGLATLRQLLGYVPEFKRSDLHREPAPMTRLNGFYDSSSNGTSAPVIETETGRCKNCGRRFKSSATRQCYNPNCSESKNVVRRPLGKRNSKTTVTPPTPSATLKPKAARTRRVVEMTTPAPLRPASPDPMVAMMAMNELSVMTAIANLPRAAATRVATWAACHFGA